MSFSLHGAAKIKRVKIEEKVMKSNRSAEPYFDICDFGASEVVGRFFRKPIAQRPRLAMFYNCRNLLFEDSSFMSLLDFLVGEV